METVEGESLEEFTEYITSIIFLGRHFLTLQSIENIRKTVFYTIDGLKCIQNNGWPSMH